MHIKSLELTGFKSYRSKKIIELDPEINVIIGENGKGKSNVYDGALALAQRAPRAAMKISAADISSDSDRAAAIVFQRRPPPPHAAPNILRFAAIRFVLGDQFGNLRAGKSTDLLNVGSFSDSAAAPRLFCLYSYRDICRYATLGAAARELLARLLSLSLALSRFRVPRWHAIHSPPSGAPPSGTPPSRSRVSLSTWSLAPLLYFQQRSAHCLLQAPDSPAPLPPLSLLSLLPLPLPPLSCLPSPLRGCRRACRTA